MTYKSKIKSGSHKVQQSDKVALDKNIFAASSLEDPTLMEENEGSSLWWPFQKGHIWPFAGQQFRTWVLIIWWVMKLLPNNCHSGKEDPKGRKNKQTMKGFKTSSLTLSRLSFISLVDIPWMTITLQPLHKEFWSREAALRWWAALYIKTII